MPERDGTTPPYRRSSAARQADADSSALSQAIAAAVKGDPAFEVKEGDESAAVALARAGKVRAAVVLPAGFGEQARRALLAGADKPVVAVHYDPSQAKAHCSRSASPKRRQIVRSW